MNPENMQAEGEQKNSVFKVTPLSKYFAMALFVVLPFLGGWVGYTLAPGKVVEVERVIEKEVEKVMEVMSNDDNKVLEESVNIALDKDTDKTIAFVSYNQGGWSGAWMLKKEGEKWVREKQIAGKYIVSDAILNDSRVFLNVSGKVGNTSDWATSVAIFDVNTKELFHVELDGVEYITNLLAVEDEIYAYGVNSGFCVDVPSSWNNDDCTGAIYVVSKSGVLTKPELYVDLPGSKQLIAYNPINETVLLRDGYGDAGCVSSFFYTYDLRKKEVVNETAFGACESAIDNSSIEVYEREITDHELKVKQDFPYHVYHDTVQSVTFADKVIVANSEPVKIDGAYRITELIVD